MFQGLSPNYCHRGRYDVVFPGSEIPEWFSHQCMGNEVNIMEPFSHLCNDWIGIAICVVFCTLPNHRIHDDLVSCILRANGKSMAPRQGIGLMVALLDHIWLCYLLPQYKYFSEEERKTLWECDANGFREIGIKINNGHLSLVKKCGLRVVYKKDIEDLNSTVNQCSNNSIIPYEGLKESMVNIVTSQVSTRNVVKS